MQAIIDIILEIFKNAEAYIAAISAVVVGLIGLFLLIPGEQPEKFLQVVLDWIKKLSRK